MHWLGELGEEVQKGTWSNDRDSTKMLERLEMLLVAGNQIVRLSRYGTFKNAMVGVVLHKA